MELKELREKIDGLDDQITDLFVERMRAAEQIAAKKRENGLAVRNASREREVLERVMERAGDGMESYAKLLYQTMFDVSCSYQHRLLDDTGEFARAVRAAAERTPALFPQKGIPSRRATGCSPCLASCISGISTECSRLCRAACANTACCPLKTAPMAPSLRYTI